MIDDSFLSFIHLTQKDYCDIYVFIDILQALMKLIEVSRKDKDKILRILSRLILWSMAGIGFLVVTLILMASFMVTHHQLPALPKKMMLFINLNASIMEAPNNNFLDNLGTSHYLFKDIIQSIDRAAQDQRVEGIIVRLETPRLGMAQIQELRDSIAKFKESKKRTLVYSTSIGSDKNGTLAYYLASAFQEIWLQPSGEINLSGFALQSPFVKGTFDLLGIKAQFGARHEYKSAIETFTKDHFSPEARQPLELLLKNWISQSNQGIAQSRNLPMELVSSLSTKAPFSAHEALDYKLVDKLAYWDEFLKETEEKQQQIIDINNYSREETPKTPSVNVALIFGIGEVVAGDDDPFSDKQKMASERIAKAFRDAVKDPAIKAILFRIDSPGGSYIAADSIWREVSNARAAGKPVIVSMGNVAASGGYFVAMPANEIIAEPGTITGSIGVFSGKFVLADFWKKIGVSWDTIQSNPNATMWSMNNSYSPAQWQKLNEMLDRVYLDFTEKTMQGRHLTNHDIDKVARGRVWSGEEAKKNGLIDSLGGYEQAFVSLRTLTKQPTKMPIHLTLFPQPKPAFQEFIELIQNEKAMGDVEESLSIFNKLIKFMSPLSHILSPGINQSELLLPLQ